MAWMVAACAGEDFSRSAACSGRGPSTEAEEDTACRPVESFADCEVAPSAPDLGASGADDGRGERGSGAASAPAHGHGDPPSTAHPSSRGHQREGGPATEDAGASPAIMVLPPSYLYPIPNNAAAAKAGVLIGDGTENGIRERAGDLLSAESLAVHLWGRSWQNQ